MPDIAKCRGTNCPLKDTCYRFTSRPSMYMQSYFGTPPIKGDGSCEYYWPEDKPLPKPSGLVTRKPKSRGGNK